MSDFIVSARKYRPATFESVVGQRHITDTLRNAVERGQLAHAYLFCGPRGVGKTTCARIFAKAINCLSPSGREACGECESCRAFDEGRSFNIHELDAASNNSVDDIRSLTEQVRIPPQIGRYSVYIIDEVHMLSAAAFNAFLKTLEEPPAHAVFILATTEKHKIIPTILSRCQIFDFNRIRVEDGVGYLRYIAGQEKVEADDESLHLIARKADGGMRDALSMFDKAVSFCGSDLRYAEVAATLNVLDYDTYFGVTDLILAGDYPSVLRAFDQVLSRGFSPQVFSSGLASHMRDLLMTKNPQTAGLLEVTGTLLEKYRRQGESCPAPLLFHSIAVLTEADGTLRTAANQRLNVELALMKLCAANQKKNSDGNGSGLTGADNAPGSTAAGDSYGASALPAPMASVSAGQGVSGSVTRSTPGVSAGKSVTKPDLKDEKTESDRPAEPQEMAGTDEAKAAVVTAGKSVTPDAVEPPATVAGPITEPVAEPVVEQVAVPVAEQTASPIAAPYVTEQTALPVAEPMANPSAETTTEPVAKPTAESTAKPAAEPTAPQQTAPLSIAPEANNGTSADSSPQDKKRNGNGGPTISGPSLEELLAGRSRRVVAAPSEGETAQQVRIDPGSQEKIVAVAGDFLSALQRERPRIAPVFAKMSVKGHCISLEVPTESMREDILLARTEILTMLARMAGVEGTLDIDVRVNAAAAPKRPIKAEEKLAHLLKANPELALLRRELDLDLE